MQQITNLKALSIEVPPMLLARAHDFAAMHAGFAISVFQGGLAMVW